MTISCNVHFFRQLLMRSRQLLASTFDRRDTACLLSVVLECGSISLECWHSKSHVRLSRLYQFLHLNNNETVAPRGDPNHDKLHKVRPLLDMVKGTIKSK